MKPLMGQVQNQAHLDDLIGSPKVKGGNFSRPAQNTSPTSRKDDEAPSFADMLLSTINKPTQSEQKKLDVKTSNSKGFSTKIPDEPRQVDRPKPKSVPPKDLATQKEPSVASRDLSSRNGMQKLTGNVDRTPNSIDNYDERAAIQKAADSASSEAKSVLAPLKKQVNGKSGSEGLLNGNAVLAFVSGRLDKLDPETLPSIVSDSLLIKQAMASGDISEFMQTPMTIADLASLLELDQGLLNKAALNGLDPSKMVSPKDFINALGIDAGRVTAELTMLQQKLPTEGIKGYIDRAKAAASINGLSTNALEPLDPQQQNSDSRDAMPGIGPATALPDSISSAIEIPVPLEISGQIAAGQMAAMNNQTNGSLSAKNSNPLTEPKQDAISQANRTKSTANEDPAELLMRQARTNGQSIIKNEFPAITDLGNNLATPGDIAITQSANKPKIELDSPDSQASMITSDGKDLQFQNDVSLRIDLNNAPTSVTDPFAEAGQLMDMQSKFAIEFGGDGLSQRSLHEHLLAQGIDAKSFAKETLNDQMTPAIDPSIITASGEVNQLNEFKLENNINMNRESLNATAQSLINGGQPELSDNGSGERESSQEFAGQFSDQASDIAAALGKGASTTRETTSVFAEKIANAPKTNGANTIASKILGHAQMMLKNGGGAMSVNVEAPGIGKVDVAINLINNQLDVRIITASEQARDMISKEITGLRDGLTQQGINLRGLEVGKAGESSPRNFAGQGQQQFGQGTQDQRANYNDMKEYVQSFRNTYVPRSNPTLSSNRPDSTRWMNKASSLMGDRRLEVRV